MKPIVAFLLFAIAPLCAQVPSLINYQGRVAVGTVNFDGQGQFKFALVNAAGSTTYWSNDGTSVAGSQPAAAVALMVTKGLYSVLLGDVTLANMTAIPASVFTNGDVRLSVWFNDGVNGFQLLAPNQRIAAVGYAMMSASLRSGAAITASTATFSGTVGIGTTTPGDPLQIGSLTTTADQYLSLATAGGNQYRAGIKFRHHDSTGGFNIEDDERGVANGLNFVRYPFGPPQTAMFIDRFSGNVGIGTTSPSAKVDVVGTIKGTSFIGSGSGLTGITSTGLAAGSVTGAQIATGAVGSTQLASNLTLAGTVTGGSALFSGRVGIETTIPSTLFSVKNGGDYGIEHTDGTRSLSTYLDTSGGWFGTTSNHPLHFYTNNNFPHVTLATNGNLGIGTTFPGARLEVSNGSIGLQVIPGFLNGTADGNSVTLEMVGNKKLGVWDDLVVSGEVTCVAVNITSDRNAKEQFKPVNAREVLDKVTRLPISEWQYKTAGDARHIGPMAQDFRAAFALGHDDKHITSVDADGVALAAIQGLNEKVEIQERDKDARIKELEKSVEELREVVKELARQQYKGAK